MNALHMWLAFIGLGIVTLCTRSFFLLLGARFQLPASVQEYLKYAPIAALIAIVIPEVFYIRDPTTTLYTFQWQWPQLIATISAVLTCVITKSVLITIFGGIAVYSLLKILLPVI